MKSYHWMCGASLALAGAAGAQNAFDQLDTLVVTGSQFLEPLKDTPTRTEVVSGEFIERGGFRNLAEVVETVAGVRVETGCTNCSFQSIQMLGLNQQYIGILQDGLPNFTGLAGVYGIEQIPAGLLGGIEVVKGGGSVLYGPGAVAGVINLLPRDPVASGGEFRLTYRDFTEGSSFGNGPSYTGTLINDWVSEDESLKATVFYSHDYLQPIDINRDGFTDISERRLRAGGLRLVWSPADGHDLSFDYMLTDEERRGGDAGERFDDPPNTNLIAEELFSMRHVATLKYDGIFNDEWSGTFAYSLSRTLRDSFYGGLGPGGVPGPGINTGDVGYGETTDDLHFVNALVFYQPSEQHRFTFGTQYRHEFIEDSSAGQGLLIDTDFSNVGVLAQHRYTPNDAWTFEYGGRVDQNSNLDDAVFLPRGSVLYTVNERLRVRGAVSTGFRAPEVFDEDLHIELVGGETQTIRNAPGLVEERATTFSLAPEWQLSDRWRLEANAYYTRLEDSFAVGGPDSGGPGVRLRENAGDSGITGIELNAGYFGNTWDVQFSWVEQRLEYDDPFEVLEADGLNPAIFVTDYVRIPDSMGQVRFTHRGEWFDTLLLARLLGPMDVPRVDFDDATGDVVSQSLERTPWFLTIDVGLRKTFALPSDQALIVDVGIRNLLNDFQDDLDTGVARDASYIYGPNFPRSVFASVAWEF